MSADLPERDSVVLDDEQHRSLTRNRVAAVKHLLSSDRHQSSWDIVLATVFEELLTGAKPVRELVQVVQRVWPGSTVDERTLDLALHEAAQSSLVEKDQSLLGPTWRLVGRGEAEVQQARVFADEIIREAKVILRDDARKHLGSLPAQSQVDLWFEIIMEAVVVGLRPLLADGKTKTINGKRLAPSRIDIDALRSSVGTSTSDDRIRQFLEAKAISALDPSSIFWNDVVHLLCVGYLLYRHVGRQDRPDGISTWRGEIVFLDTPILIALTESPIFSNHLLTLIGHLLSLGVRVCVADLTEAELERVIESESGNARTIGLKLAGGVDAEVLVSSLSGPLRSWMTFHIGSSSRNLSWEQFLRHVQTVLQNLRAIGCESFECLTGDLLATSRIVAFRASLAEAVSERKGRPRTEAALSHDANLLYQVEESRKRNPATDFKPWPGAVIITTDTFLDLTYRDVSGSDAVFPVAASAAQLATVVSESVEPATAELLVETASREILSGGLLQRAARIPTEAAIELANALSGGSASDPTDVQLTLDELLRDEAGLSGSETQIRNAVNAAITRRALWTNRALEEHRTRTRGYEEAAEIRVQVSTETEANLTTQNHSLTELVQRSGATNEQLLAELRAKSEEVLSAEERTKQQLRRVGVGAVPTLLCVAIGTYIFLRPSHWAAKLLFLASAAYLLFEVAMYVSDHNARARDLIRGILSLTVGSIIGVFGPVLLAPADAKPSRPDPKTAPSTKPNQVRPKPKTASSLKPAAKP